MEKNIEKKYYLIAATISTVFCMTFLTTFYLTVTNEINQNKHKEKLDTIEKFIHFKSQTENLFNLNENILKGYIAYIKTHPEITYEESNKYLSKLIVENGHLIRNISTLKDTTVVSVYPSKGNEAAIGVDISKILGQSEKVLEVKNTFSEILQGKIELIQGGLGFILRIPVVIDGGDYWGQVSIVIDADKFIEKALSYGEQNNLDIAIFNKNSFPERPFLGDKNILKNKPIILDMELNNSIWKAAVIPKNGWKKTNPEFFTKISFIVFLILAASTMLYNNIITRFKLKNQVIYDHMTGLYNRTFLEGFQQLVFEKSKRNNTMVGVLLLDINDFKFINDNYGHKTGDEILKLISSQLTKGCRKSEAVFRLGGDEFMVIIPDIINAEDIDAIKDRISKAVDITYSHLNDEISIKTSIGSALYPLNGTNFDEVSHAADEDMYEQKILSKNKMQNID